MPAQKEPQTEPSSTPDPRTIPATETAYVRFKGDGWPLCPGCGEDELWSNAVPATMDTIVNCLACDWRPIPKATRI